MKKIALVISTMKAGGGERVVATLSKEFAKHHDVTIIVFDDSHIDYEYGGKLFCINYPDRNGLLGKASNLLARKRILQWYFGREQFDYIFGFMESANYPSILASRKTIASLHIDPAFLSRSERFLLRILYPLASQVAPVSEDIAHLLRTQHRLKNVTTIYNPVPVVEITQLANRPRPHLHRYILAVGRLTYQKHFDLLIDAYNNSRAKQDCDLIILGEGDLRKELETQVTQHAFSPNSKTTPSSNSYVIRLVSDRACCGYESSYLSAWSKIRGKNWKNPNFDS